ncbi:MAG: hypothetical protein JW769_02465 [Parachlamydiales bacterium]|nr:hypothetical protein [Parachlamydiales bacterium]
MRHIILTLQETQSSMKQLVVNQENLLLTNLVIRIQELVLQKAACIQFPANQIVL